MGMNENSGSGIGYAGESGGGLNPWVGWGISTLLLFSINRKNKTSNTNSQQPSKYTADNVNCIGKPVPVVLGRCMVKSPLVSYYGDFGYEPYTEEYGMHTNLDAASLLWPILLQILMALIAPSTHPVQVGTPAGPGTGYAADTQNGTKFDALVAAIIKLLIALLFWLFSRHEGRTTIQKGFLYYLGW